MSPGSTEQLSAPLPQRPQSFWRGFGQRAASTSQILPKFYVWRECLASRVLCALNFTGTQKLRLPCEYRTGSACMVDQNLSDLSEPLCARPITLQFSGHAKPRNRLGSSSHQAADGHVMCFRRDATRRIGSDVHIIAITHRMDSGHRQTHLGPESGDDQLLPAGLLHRLNDAAVLPCVDESAVNRLLIRKDCLDLLKDYASAFLIDGCENRRNTVCLRGFG